MSIKFDVRLIRRVPTGISRLLCVSDYVSTQNIYFADLDKNLIGRIALTANSFSVDGITHLQHTNVHEIGNWYYQREIGQICDIALHTDACRMYLLVVVPVEDHQYDTKIVCVDLYDNPNGIVNVFAYLPNWSVFDSLPTPWVDRRRENIIYHALRGKVHTDFFVPAPYMKTATARDERRWLIWNTRPEDLLDDVLPLADPPPNKWEDYTDLLPRTAQGAWRDGIVPAELQWSMDFKNEFGKYQTIPDIHAMRKHLNTCGLGTHSMYIDAQRIYEMCSICAYMNYIYVLCPVFYAPFFTLLMVLYVFREATHEEVGVGIIGELPKYLPWEKIRPMKSNILAVDGKLILRSMRLALLPDNWTQTCHKFDESDVVIKQDHRDYFQLSQNVVDYIRQPYNICCFDIKDLHSQLVGSSILNPANLVGEDMFNAQIFGNPAFQKITSSLNYRRLYATMDGWLYEYQLDFLMIEFYLRERWVKTDGLDFPYRNPNGGKVPIRITNTASYVNLRDIRIRAMSNEMYLSPAMISVLPAGASVELELVYLNPPTTIIEFQYGVYR